MIENSINFQRHQKNYKVKLKDQNIKLENTQIKQCIKQFTLMHNFMKDVQQSDLYLDDIIDYFEYQEFNEGDILFKQQDFICDDNCLFFVISGKVSTFEMKSSQAIKLLQKQYQELLKLRKQLAQNGKNQDYQSSKRFLDQIINIENELQIKQQEELYEICSRNQNIKDYFYSDWKNKMCKYNKKEDLSQDSTIGESDIFNTKRQFTCLVSSKVLRTLKISIKIFYEGFFSKVFQIQFLSQILKDSLHLYDQSQQYIQIIAEQFTLQYFQNHIYQVNEDVKGIYVLLFGSVVQVNGDKELSTLNEGDLFGFEDFYSEKRRQTYILRNEEKAKVYFLKKDFILENKHLSEQIIKLNNQKLTNSSQFGHGDANTRRMHFDKRFKITEDMLGNNSNGINTQQYSGNRNNQKQKYINQNTQKESADENINNSKRILEKQQQPFIQTLQEQKYLQHILSQQKKISFKIPSLFISEENKLKQFQNTISKSPSYNQLDSNTQSNRQSSLNKYQQFTQQTQTEMNDCNTPFQNTSSLIESLKIYFTSKRNTPIATENEIEGLTPSIKRQSPYQNQKVYQITDEKRDSYRWNSKMNLKKQEQNIVIVRQTPSQQQNIQQFQPQSLLTSSNLINFDESQKGKILSLAKNPLTFQSILSTLDGSSQYQRRPHQQLEEYIEDLKSQKQQKQNSNLSENNRKYTMKNPLIKQNNQDFEIDLQQNQKDKKQQEEQNDNQNNSSIYSNIRKDSIQQTKQSARSTSVTNLHQIQERRNSSVQNKSKVTIASFISNQTKSQITMQDNKYDQLNSFSADSLDIQINQDMSPPIRRYPQDNLNMSLSENQQELDLNQNFEKKVENIINNHNQLKTKSNFQIQNTTPIRKDEIKQTIVNKDSQINSPTNQIELKNQYNQLLTTRKFQPQNNSNIFSSTLTNFQKDRNTNLLKSAMFSNDKLNTDNFQTPLITNNSILSNQNIRFTISKKNSLSNLNDIQTPIKQINKIQFKEKICLQSFNQLKEQKNQITKAIEKETLVENTQQIPKTQRNALNLKEQINNQKRVHNNNEFQSILKPNKDEKLFANEILNVLFQRNQDSDSEKL